MEPQDWTTIYVYLSMLGAAAFVWVTMAYLPWHKITLYISIVAVTVLGFVVLFDNLLRTPADDHHYAPNHATTTPIVKPPR